MTNSTLDITQSFDRPQKLLRLYDNGDGTYSIAATTQMKRDASFKKARLVMEKKREEKKLADAAEKARQDVIYNNRVKSLRKARRARRKNEQSA